MTDRPVPMTPEGCDLRDFPHTPIFRARLFGSSFNAHATDSEWRVGVTLWLKSWDQVPAGSLPADEVELCRLAELGRDLKAFRKLRDGALRGWVVCSDERLYHPVVAEGVNNAVEAKAKQRAKTAKARIAALEKHLKEAQSDEDRARITDEISRIKQTLPQGLSQTLQLDPREGEGKEKGRDMYSAPNGAGSAGAAPVVDNSGSDPTAEQESKRALWRDAKDWLVSNGCTAGDARAFVNTLAKEHPAVIEQALREAIKVRREPGDAKPYLSGIVERLAAESRKLTPTDRAERAVEATQERLRQQAERTPDPAPEAVRERLAAARAALAASAGLAPKPADAPAEPEGAPA